MVTKKSLIPLVILTVITSLLSFSRNSIWRDGMTLWSDVVKKAPENTRALFNLALQYHALKQPDTALSYLRKIIELGEYNWYVMSKMASILAEKGLYNEAIVWHNRAISVASGVQKSKALSFMGVTFFKKGDYEEAERLLKKAIEIDPQNVEAYYNLGVVYYYKNDIDRAIERFLIATRLKPDYFDAYFNLGVIYGNRGDLDRAIEYFSRALFIKETPEAYLKRSLAYRLKGDRERAERDLRKAQAMEE